MKFSIATLLLVTAFVAIACAACIGWWPLTVFAPLWLPIAFVAYAIGRRTLSVWLVLIFAVTEGIAWLAAGVALGLLRAR